MPPTPTTAATETARDKAPPLAELMPHGPSMRFLDALVRWDDQHVVCRVVPGGADAPWATDGMVPATLALEYMAQAVSVYVGLRKEPSERDQPGFIVGVRNLVFDTAGFEVGQALEVLARWEWGDGDIGRFEGRVTAGGEVLARANITVCRPDWNAASGAAARETAKHKGIS